MSFWPSGATKGGWWNFSERNLLFLNTTRTAKVKGPNDLIASVLDKSPLSSTLNQSSGSARPAFDRSWLGLWGARFDGSQFFPVAPAYNHSKGQLTVIAAIQMNPAAQATIYGEARASHSNPRIRLGLGSNPTAGYSGDKTAMLYGTARHDDTSVGSNIFGQMTPADDLNRIVTLRIRPDPTVSGNRILETWIDDWLQSSEVFGGLSLTLDKAAIGAMLRGTASEFFKGLIFEMMVVDVALSDTALLKRQSEMALRQFSPELSAAGASTQIQFPGHAVMGGSPVVGTTSRTGSVLATELSISPTGFRGPCLIGRRFGTMNSHFDPSLRMTPENELVLIAAPHGPVSTPLAVHVSYPSHISAWQVTRDDVIPGLVAYAYSRTWVYGGVWYNLIRGRLSSESGSELGLWLVWTPNIKTTPFSNKVKLVSGNRPYATGGEVDANGRVSLLISTGNPADGGPVNDVVHAILDLPNRTMHKTDLTPVANGSPVSDFTNLHDSVATGLLSWVSGPPWKDRDGNHRAAYQRYNNDGTQSLMFRKESGGDWSSPVEVARSAGAAGDVAVAPANWIAPGCYAPDPRNPDVILASWNMGPKAINGAQSPLQIHRHVSYDEGETWGFDQITFDRYSVTTPEIMDIPDEPRLLAQGNAEFGNYDNFGHVRMKLLHSGRGDIR